MIEHGFVHVSPASDCLKCEDRSMLVAYLIHMKVWISLWIKRHAR